MESTPPQEAPLRLSELLARAEQVVRGGRREQMDPVLERLLSSLMRRVQRATVRGRLPVDPRQLPAVSKLIAGPFSYRSPYGTQSSNAGGGDGGVRQGYYAGPGKYFGAIYGSVVVAGGPVRVGTLMDSVLIATGDVRVSNADRSVVIAGGSIDVGMDGLLLGLSGGFASVYVSAGRIEGGRSYGGVFAGADGVVVPGTEAAAVLNAPATGNPRLQVYRDEGLILTETPGSPTLEQLEVGLFATKSPARREGVYLFRKGEGQPIAVGRAGELVRSVGSGPLPPELAGVRVEQATDTVVVLRGASARAVLQPTRPRREPPRPPSVTLPPDGEAHVVGVYQSTRGDSAVDVEVDRPGVPILLVLCAYEPVRWRIHVAPGSVVVGAVIGGYHAPAAVEGLPEGVPVLTRVGDFGEPYLYDYPGRRDKVERTAEQLVRELTGRDPASFQGAERGDHYRIGR